MLAHRLAERRHDVTLFEAAPEIGGLASAWSIDVPGANSAAGGRVTWDRHYHVTLLSDRRTQEFVSVAGLGDQFRWVETKTGYYGTDGSLRSVSDAVEFLTLPGLNPLDKARLAATILYGSKVRDGERMEGVPVDVWLQRWSGRATFERFWRPLLRAKLGDGFHAASAAFIWATIQRLYAARRTGLKKEMFGYVPGGYANVFERFGARLVDEGVKVVTSAGVESVRRCDGGVEVVRATANDRFDDVVVTTNASLAADLCPDLAPAELRRLRRIRYMGIVCPSLLLRRPLGPYYLTYITDPSTPFTAVVEMTAFVDAAQVGGHHLVYLPKYVTPDDPLFEASDADIEATFMPYLTTMYPDVTDDDVLAFQVSRVRRVFAVPTLDYSTWMPPMETSVPGLHLVGSAQLPFATLNVNDTLGLVGQFLESLG
jgi:protoporphyrinogen oxidase